jgi:hypothetical protein
VSFKFNEAWRETLPVLRAALERRFEVTGQQLLDSEFPVLVDLEFGLQAAVAAVYSHFSRIAEQLQEVRRSPMRRCGSDVKTVVVAAWIL